MVFSLFLSHSVNAFGRSIRLTRNLHASSALMVKVGENIPAGELTEGTPANKVDIHELAKDKKVIILGVPGAFTPGCSKTHVPGYVSKAEEFKQKGIQEIICISVNDAFVMDAWSKDLKAEGKVRMLADADGSFTKSLNLDTKIAPLGGLRSKRYSMVVENLVVKQLSVEPDGTGLTCSLADKIAL